MILTCNAAPLSGLPFPRIGGGDPWCRWQRRSRRQLFPAYAGKRQATERCSIAGQDHPRLCGEKLKDRLVTAASKGSPPPMRGKACCVMPAFSRSRITPAYAGKSAQIEQAKFVLQDHPRLCGEKKSFRGKLQSRIGSPPPMRGKVKATPPHRNEPRITPAYAGKSLR